MRFGVDAHVAAGFMAGINANGVNTGRCRRDLDDEKRFVGGAAGTCFGHASTFRARNVQQQAVSLSMRTSQQVSRTV